VSPRRPCSTRVIAGLLRRVLPVGLGLGIVLTGCPLAAPAGGYSPGKAGFTIKFKEEISPYKVIAMFVLPNEVVTIEALGAGNTNALALRYSAGEVTESNGNHWRWRAPGSVGDYSVAVIDSTAGDSIKISAFVMVPYSDLKGEYLNGYRIGKYPSVSAKLLPIYKPPRGFIEVTRANEDRQVSPHFRLKQFVCKQEGGYPRYVVLRERLLLKLEVVLEEANRRGYNTGTFEIMSGYRTPYYNKAIGNVRYSRHLWGGAADIFIDQDPADGMMDDLNADGKIDYRDAEVLYDIVEGLYDRPWYERFLGGLAWYRRTRSHGPFVHVDVRGFRARWGD
jgi:hypothetical protein